MRELDIQALPENLPEVLTFVKENLDELECTEKERNQIEVAVEEIFSNIAGYAYDPKIGTATIRVELNDNPLSVSMSFIDQGKQYDPLAKPDPNVKLSASERKRGGLGIFMTKKFMDEVDYEYKDGRNILTLRKVVLRQPEVDMTKALVIFFLATIHAFVECSTDDALWHGLPYFFDSILGGPWAAPMFIFSMGIGLAFTTRNKAKDLFIRSINIFIVGLFLNVLRFLIPSLVGYAATHDAEFYLERLPYLFFGNDLLQFAALAMLLMSFMKFLKLTPWKIFFVALGINIIAMFFNDLWLDNMPLNVILGHFVGVNDPAGEEIVMSDFPLFIWFLMYASGLAFGDHIKHITTAQKETFYKWFSIPCFILSTSVYIFEYYNQFGMMGGPGANVFYHLTTPEMFLCICTEFAMLGACYYICKFLPAKVMGVIETISRAITSVYFAQWVLVWWTVNVFIYVIRGDKYLDSIPTLILGLILSVASVLIGVFYQKQLKKRKRGRNSVI